MKQYKYKSLPGFVLLTSVLLFAGCRKMTEDHVAVTDPALDKNLLELVGSQAKYSTFARYLAYTDYDDVLASSKTFTLFAPTNDALATLDPAIVNDPVRLKRFVANHICEESLPLHAGSPARQIRMFNGKSLSLTATSLEGTALFAMNQYASNGVVHELRSFIPARYNCWEFATSTASPAKQRNFMLSLFRNVFDPINAVVTGINPLTGAPIYKPGTDSVFTNMFWRQVHDLRNEEKRFTLFMVADAGWDAEMAANARYFPTSTPDSTTFATGWNIVRDFAVDTLLEPGKLPDTVTSRFGARIPINKAAIRTTVKTSNGYVYVMDALPVAPLQRFRPRVIEAEQYIAASHDRRSNTFFRDRYNDVLRTNYSDVLVLNHGIALFNLRYDLSEMPAVKYKAYWIAVNDFQTAAYTQRLGIGSPLSTLLPYTNVAANVKTEVYLGEFTMPRYFPVLSLFLTAANSTANAANPLVCDYIKLVPGL
jgi:uncharacterized surface protein with fasciclin (FAS1) repeats